MTSNVFLNMHIRTLQNYLTIAFLAVSFFTSGSIVDPVSAQSLEAGEAAARRPMEPLRSKYLRFGRITSEDGLSNDQVRGVAQDSYGFMWVATFDGLNRYDGSSIKVYRHDPDDPNSLSNNLIRLPIVDQNGVLWFGTLGGGLNQYVVEKDAFIRYQHDPDNPRSLSDNNIRTIFEDQAGTIWVGTNKGLNKLNRDSKQFTRYIHNPDDPNSISNNVVLSVFEDTTGAFWIGTEEGLDRFDPIAEQFIHYRHAPDDPTSLSGNNVRSICEDSSGVLWMGTTQGLCELNPERTHFNCYQHVDTDPQTISNNIVIAVYVDRTDEIWVGTWGGGLNWFDRKTENFIRYKHHPHAPYSLSSNNVDRIYEDRQGILWLSTDGGVSMLDGMGKPFYHYHSTPNIPNSLSNDEVRSLYADRAGGIWVGTNGGGLSKFDRRTEKFTHYRHDPDEPSGLMGNSVWAIHEDREGQIWVGVYGFGLSKFDPNTEQFVHYWHEPENPLSLSSNVISAIHEDRNGSIWVGTEDGLNKYDGHTFTRYHHDPRNPQSLSSNYILTIYEDRSGELWLGTWNGLTRFSPIEGEFTHYQHVPGDSQSLGNNTVISIHEDQTGTFWVGTAGGLGRFDRGNDQFTHFTTRDGLSSDAVYGILEDEQGLLWLSTANGISRFDPRTESFRNYDVRDGLQSNSFLYYSAYAKSQNGEMFFGGTKGFNAFYPDEIIDNSQPPPVFINDFHLANKRVPIGDDSVLQKSILETDELVLSYQDNIFSFEFVALDYRNPQKNHYKYKMEGFQEEWNEVGSIRRFATYTNLDPGDYVFRVIASNNDGFWNEEGASINIIITPPWWETVWFRSVMSAALIMMGIGVFRWRVSSNEARRRELEIQVQTRTRELETANKNALEAKESAETANRAKSTFLANMSHELRTPLNAILGFSRILVRAQNATADQKEQLNIINRSGQHLLSMINDVLDLSKIEARRVKLRENPFDLVVLMEEIGAMIQSQSRETGLLFEVETEMAAIRYIKADEGKLRQILINLLDNAVKFTDEGVIALRCTTEQIQQDPTRCRIVIEVEDTGLGVAPDRQEKIFEPFAQGIYVHDARKGTGLGLSISKNFVELMNGTIEVESEVEKGSLFRVKLPAKIAEATDLKTGEEQQKLIGLAPAQPAQRVLIVEDNRENRLLLGSLLREAGFETREARNGEEAVDLFQQYHPHFIWMDILMPVMDGYQATANIRSLPGGDTVKIVAITASVYYEQRQDILKAGCDDVVYKPFEDYEIFRTMGRMLDIEYLYEEDGEEALPRERVSLTKEMLADLPEELLDEFREKILELNREAALEVISRIAEFAPDVATGLKEQVDNFQMVELQQLLE